jgi:hypothetical protein
MSLNNVALTGAAGGCASLCEAPTTDTTPARTVASSRENRVAFMTILAAGIVPVPGVRATRVDTRRHEARRICSVSIVDADAPTAAFAKLRTLDVLDRGAAPGGSDV